MVSTRGRLAALLLLALAAACGGGSTEPSVGRVARLEVVSGSAQTGVVGTELGMPVVVHALDDKGHDVKQQIINFRVVSGGGSVFAGTSITTEHGIAQERWTLGTDASLPQVLEARAVDNVTGEAIVFARFECTAVHDAPARLSLVGDNQLGTVDRELPATLAARVSDRFDNPVPGTAVDFSVTGGGGAVLTSQVVTGDAGPSPVQWRLGTVPGLNSLRVAVGASLALTATATARPGPASALVILSGDGQIGEVATRLAQPLVVLVTDAFGNPAPGVEVSFLVQAGGGGVPAGLVSTDAAGRASAEWILGSSPGANQVVVTAAGAGSILFEATAAAGTPALLLRVGGDGQVGRIGAALPAPVTVCVQDALGNPLAGVDVVFAASSGSISPAAAVTDPLGLAQATWTLGTAAGPQPLVARVSGLPPATFGATATAGPPATLTRLRGGNEFAAVAEAVPTAPAVTVRDEFGNPVAGTAVAFSSIAPGAVVSPLEVTAGPDGVAGTSWQLGTVAGPQELNAEVTGLPPLRLTAMALPGPVQSIGIVGGDQQTAAVRTLLPAPEKVRVADRFGNGVPGATVTFTVIEGDGAVSPASAVTAADGGASTNWTLGSALGLHRLQALVTGASAVVFHAHAVAAPPDRLVVVAGDGQTGTAGAALPGAVSVRVLDAGSSPVDGVAVHLAADAGGAPADAVVVTDPSGTATFSWTLGAGPGAQHLVATVTGLAPLTLIATAVCAAGLHDDGAGACVASGCAPGFHDDGQGRCISAGCASGYHDGGDGTCVAEGTCIAGFHDGGGGACAPAGTCAPGFFDGGGGTCVARGCAPGYVLGASGCVPSTVVATPDRIGSNPTIGQDGAGNLVLVAWVENTLYGGLRSTLARSEDGGATFASPQDLGNFPPSYYLSGFPVPLVKEDGTVLMLSFERPGCNGSTPYVQASTDRGHSFVASASPYGGLGYFTVGTSFTWNRSVTQFNVIPQGSYGPGCSGGLRTGELDYYRSVDGGRTWQLTALTPQDGIGRGYPSVGQLDSGAVIATWVEATNPSRLDIQVRSSSDGGVTFTAPLSGGMLSAGMAGTVSGPSLRVAGDVVTVLFGVGATGYASTSTDGGVTFSAPAPVSLAAPGFRAIGPAIASLWGNDAGLYCRVTQGGGQTWSEPRWFTGQGPILGYSNFSEQAGGFGVPIRMVWLEDGLIRVGDVTSSCQGAAP